MKTFLSVLVLSTISVSSHADEGKAPPAPFKSDYGQYSIVGCSGQTFQLDCKLKSVIIGAANSSSNSKAKGSSVGFVFKTEDDTTVTSDLWLSSADRYEVEDDKATLTTSKTKNTSNWSEESQEITLDKSEKNEWVLTFTVNRDNLGKSIKRQIEFKIRKK